MSSRGFIKGLLTVCFCTSATTFLYAAERELPGKPETEESFPLKAMWEKVYKEREQAAIILHGYPDLFSPHAERCALHADKNGDIWVGMTPSSVGHTNQLIKQMKSASWLSKPTYIEGSNLMVAHARIRSTKDAYDGIATKNSPVKALHTPSKDQIDGVLLDVNNAALAAGLSFNMFFPQDVIYGTGYRILPIKTELEGSHKGMEEFLAYLNHMDYGITLEEIDLTGGCKKAEKLKLKTILMLYAVEQE